MHALGSIVLAAGIATTCAAAISPAAIYDGGIKSQTSASDLIRLRIANGGAGQNGLIKALADAFIQQSFANGSDPFTVAWYLSDTTYSIQYLRDGLVDVGITYSPAAEQIAIDQGAALAPAYYAFRDHFLIVGPPSNPANLTNATDAITMFSDLHEAADAAAADAALAPVRFLSRYDKSATNIKEAGLWIAIGQVPWATAYSTWYHQYIAFPVQALTAAILLEEYTLTDRSTLLSLPPELTAATVVYKASTDTADDPLLNPAHLLVGARAPDPQMAAVFAEWLVSADGQSVISGFEKNGEKLFSPAPADQLRMGIVKRFFQ